MSTVDAVDGSGGGRGGRSGGHCFIAISGTGLGLLQCLVSFVIILRCDDLVRLAACFAVTLY